jgi:GNAT superfamily N-acetyltransferase
MTQFRPATRDDVPAIVALLTDDELGAARESDDLAPYLAAFDALEGETGNHLIVGQDAVGRVVASYQISFISGLSLRAARRAQIESVRVVSDLRGTGLGAQMLQDAEIRARAAGCTLMQLTTNATRARAQAFYKRMGFTPSHVGFKRDLS